MSISISVAEPVKSAVVVSPANEPAFEEAMVISLSTSASDTTEVAVTKLEAVRVFETISSVTELATKDSVPPEIVSPFAAVSSAPETSRPFIASTLPWNVTWLELSV